MLHLQFMILDARSLESETFLRFSRFSRSLESETFFMIKFVYFIVGPTRSTLWAIGDQSKQKARAEFSYTSGGLVYAKLNTSRIKGTLKNLQVTFRVTLSVMIRPGNFGFSALQVITFPWSAASGIRLRLL